MSTLAINPPALGGTRYKEVKSAILAALSAGEWKGGECIPSEKRLAERFGVSIGTLRKAIDELCAENILIRHQGLGTFVSMHQRDRHFFRFFRVVRRDGDKAYPVVTLIDFKKARASREVAAMLGIETGARVFQFVNGLALHGKTVLIEHITVPEAQFPALTEAKLRNRPNTLYNFYQDVFGINVVETDERVSVALANEIESAQLGVEVGAPLLEIRRIAYSYHRSAVELRVSRLNTDEYEYIGARPGRDEEK
ncbi:GntR family transcriptional regulator [Paraburkholderia ginsengisoli]|jgi:GntR family transcriptional regulator|uniref:GntR family transcriptional regulator n=1 Tax=Paraburkholderia ginsengisoli TaxID=311231 RepID=A0A7T4TBY9_9BURK|nr:GntR family transcriptional regulator [Paraburkholderia ginsengisoli]QQC67485.1 GntR family transcriptional regulator [Paraburkholderia ginsengisoli]